MTIFDLCPEELTTLALIIAIGFGKQFPQNEGQLEVLSEFFSAIGDNIGLIQTQREILAARVEACKSNKSDS